MSQHPRYPELWEGPLVDGEQTWFCFGRDIPKGAMRRMGYTSSWRPYDYAGPATAWDLYQVKDVPLPDPHAYHQAEGELITTAMYLQDRLDLDQWEWYTADGDWRPVAGRTPYWDGLFPVRIRRRKR